MFLDLNDHNHDHTIHSSNYSPFKVQGLLEGMVNVIITDRKERLVNMRELHEILEVKTRYNDWIQRKIEQIGYEEDQEYYSILSSSNNNRNGLKTDHYFLLDAAKEVAMMENNEMGKKFRKYFIDMEQAALRFLGKITRRSLTDAIREKWKPESSKFFGKATNELVYKQIFNRTAKQLIEERKIEGNLRDALTKEELKAVETVEQEATKFIDEYNQPYEEVLRLLNIKYRSKLLISNKLQHQVLHHHTKQSFFLH